MVTEMDNMVDEVFKFITLLAWLNGQCLKLIFWVQFLCISCMAQIPRFNCGSLLPLEDHLL